MPEFSEDQMADVVVAHSEELLGEPLALVARKHWIGRYELDLVFKDRHGATLIVELQRGALDRYHLYKVLDYYDEYRDRHRNEFAEVMVVANIISPERKERLAKRGIGFREVPEAIVESLMVPSSGPDDEIEVGRAEVSTEESVRHSDASAQPELPDRVRTVIERAVARSVDQLRAALKAGAVDETTGRLASREWIEAHVAAQASTMRRVLEEKVSELARSYAEPWTESKVEAATAVVMVLDEDAVAHPGWEHEPADKAVLREAMMVSVLHHLELLLKPQADSMLAAAMPLLLSNSGGELHASLVRLLTLRTNSMSAESWLESRRTEMATFVEACLARPSVLARACGALSHWATVFRIVERAHSGKANDPLSNLELVFILTQRLLGGLCAEALWRISLERFKTREIVIGSDATGEWISTPYRLPDGDFARFETFLKLAHFWALPASIRRLWKQGDQFVLKDNNDELFAFPELSDPFRIAAEMLATGYRDKVYTATIPSEVVMNVGDIRTITILECGTHVVGYRVRYVDGRVSFGSLSLADDKEGGAAVLLCASTESVDRSMIGGLHGTAGILNPQDGGEFALVAAIVRDFFVCEERDRFYQPERPLAKGSAKPLRPGLTVRYLPRIKLRYIGIRDREYSERKVSVVGHAVSGHLRRVRIAGSATQITLAREYDVNVPEGYTFVRPHQRGSYEHVVYRSRSALELVYGGRPDSRAASAFE